MKFSKSFDWVHPRLLLVPRAVWLGLLDTDELNEITRFGYEYLWDFWSEEFNIQQGLWKWEDDAVRKYLLNCDHILVAGAGGGREVIALSKLGLNVTAIDFSENLITACRHNLEVVGLKARVLISPPDLLPPELIGEVFDGVFVGRGFYHHIPQRKRRIAFLANCYGQLAPNAFLFLSDFFTRDRDSPGHVLTKNIANSIRRIRRDSARVELGDWLSYAMQHAFNQDEIESELREAGFLLECYSASPFGPDSHLAHAVARKS